MFPDLLTVLGGFHIGDARLLPERTRYKVHMFVIRGLLYDNVTVLIPAVTRRSQETLVQIYWRRDSSTICSILPKYYLDVTSHTIPYLHHRIRLEVVQNPPTMYLPPTFRGDVCC